jgi:hypothetical protein
MEQQLVAHLFAYRSQQRVGVQAAISGSETITQFEKHSEALVAVRRGQPCLDRLLMPQPCFDADTPLKQRRRKGFRTGLMPVDRREIGQHRPGTHQRGAFLRVGNGPCPGGHAERHRGSYCSGGDQCGCQIICLQGVEACCILWVEVNRSDASGGDRRDVSRERLRACGEGWMFGRGPTAIQTGLEQHLTDPASFAFAMAGSESPARSKGRPAWRRRSLEFNVLFRTCRACQRSTLQNRQAAGGRICQCVRWIRDPRLIPAPRAWAS